MILSVIRGRGKPPELEALRAALRAKLGRTSGESEGPARFHVGTRPGNDEVEVVAISCWSNAEAATRGDARGISPYRIAADTLAEVRVSVFEVDESIIRRSDLDAVALRIATGRFSKPGTDIEMQELLRARAPLVGEEMIEAYVGRRLVEGSIEVTFVSAWQQIPSDRRLEDPFWTDISLRYDQFEVEVYATLAIEA